MLWEHQQYNRRNSGQSFSWRKICGFQTLSCSAGSPGNSRFRPEVVKHGGKQLFPYLMDENTGVHMYESVSRMLEKQSGSEDLKVDFFLTLCLSSVVLLDGYGVFFHRMWIGSRRSLHFPCLSCYQCCEKFHGECFGLQVIVGPFSGEHINPSWSTVIVLTIVHGSVSSSIWEWAFLHGGFFRRGHLTIGWKLIIPSTQIFNGEKQHPKKGG